MIFVLFDQWLHRAYALRAAGVEADDIPDSEETLAEMAGEIEAESPASRRRAVEAFVAGVGGDIA